MKILIIDNYDSFTYNLVHLVGRFEKDIIVKRNDKISVENIGQINPDKIVISPGPGRPENSKVSIEAIKVFGGKIPILGVCLGHQGIGYVYGAKIINAKKLMHGKTSQIDHSSQGIFKGLQQKFLAGRYHSLVIDRSTIPEQLEITAETSDGEIMAVRHKEFRIDGVQFHPESVLTEVGYKIINNWLYYD